MGTFRSVSRFNPSTNLFLVCTWQDRAFQKARILQIEAMHGVEEVHAAVLSDPSGCVDADSYTDGSQTILQSIFELEMAVYPMR